MQKKHIQRKSYNYYEKKKFDFKENFPSKNYSIIHYTVKNQVKKISNKVILYLITYQNAIHFFINSSTCIIINYPSNFTNLATTSTI